MESNQLTPSNDTSKRAWLQHFVITLLVFTVGGCLVVDGDQYTLIEAFIGSAIVAFAFAEVIGLIKFIFKKDTFVLTTHLAAKLFNATPENPNNKKHHKKS